MESVILGSVEQGEGDVFEVDKVVKHEDFDDSEDPIKNDLAVITLRQSVAFKDSVYPICLPQYAETFSDEMAIVAGET